MKTVQDLVNSGIFGKEDDVKNAIIKKKLNKYIIDLEKKFKLMKDKYLKFL